MSKTYPDKADGHFLAHHGVVKETSTTHKVRPVWNAALRSISGKSLNDCLCTGPNVPELFDIIVRIRKGAYVFKADVEKMYLQINVHQSQRKYQKALWRELPGEPLCHFTLNCVTFGLAPSSFLATNTSMLTTSFIRLMTCRKE